MSADDTSRLNQATVSVWGKGYRVSIDSEEFQLFVPPSSDRLIPTEFRLRDVPWGRVLESLYRLSDRAFGLQRAALFLGPDVLTIAFSRTEDRHGRPSLVMTTATSSVNWADDHALSPTVSRAVALAMRLAREYAKTFERNPPTVEAQLRANSFLKDRRFTLEDEQLDARQNWANVLSAVRRFQGVSGVATPPLMLTGANVLLGTRHEAERAIAQGTLVDGFYDVRTRSIVPLTDTLAPWPEVAPQPEVRSTETAENNSEHERLLESLDRMEGMLEVIADAVSRLLHLKERRKK